MRLNPLRSAPERGRSAHSRPKLILKIAHRPIVRRLCVGFATVSLLVEFPEHPRR
jgi:hypothetical protein